MEVALVQDQICDRSIREIGGVAEFLIRIFAPFSQHVDRALTDQAQYWSRDSTNTLKNPAQAGV
jgi:hypothetical protein